MLGPRAWLSSVLAADPSGFPQEMSPPPQLCFSRTLGFVVVAGKRTGSAVGFVSVNLERATRCPGRGHDGRADEVGCSQEKDAWHTMGRFSVVRPPAVSAFPACAHLMWKSSYPRRKGECQRMENFDKKRRKGNGEGGLERGKV